MSQNVDVINDHINHFTCALICFGGKNQSDNGKATFSLVQIKTGI